MRKTIAIVAVMMTFIFHGNAQTAVANAPKEKPYIEVIGTNSMEITPDMLYISITLREKKSISIDTQEDTLKNIVQRCGIPMTKLTINKAQSTYSRIGFVSKSGVSQKVYTLLLSDAASMGKIFAEFEKSGVISYYYLEKTSHTKIDSLKREVKIKAIKDAKIQADYLLNAINEKVGKPIEIREVANNIIVNYGNTRGARSEETITYIDGVKVASGSYYGSETEINVQDIKIEIFIYIKFEIQ